MAEQPHRAPSVSARWRIRLRLYAFGLAAPALALLGTWLLWPEVEPGFFELFLAAVVVTAWRAGLGPALVATFASVLTIDYYFVPPIYAINFHPGDTIRLVMFTGVSLLIVALTRAKQRARDQADAASRAKDRVLAVVSHDLRNPLNAVLGWVPRLRRLVSQPEAVRALDVIEHNIGAQRQLIEDLLDMVRIEANALRLEPRPVDIAEVVRATLDAVRPAADAKDIALELAIDANPHVVWVDPVRLEQATGNLLANAVRFTPPRGRVRVGVTGDGARATIRVHDSGPGIPDEALSGIFTGLEDAPTRRGSRGDGLGLGLAIARRIVELHGGTLEAASVTGEVGALFTIVLPSTSGVPSSGRGAEPPGRAAGPLSSLRAGEG